MKNEKEKRFISVGDAAAFTGLDAQTVRKLFDTEKISGYKTPSGQRKIDRGCIQKMCNTMVHDKKEQESKKQNFLYTRVSTKKQVDDLSRQIEYVRRPEYANYILIEDIGSGINFKRKGLSTILDSCIQRTIGEVVVAHRDRLCRFGFELIEQLVTKAGGKITVLENNKLATPQEELADDLLSIIHIFSCRQMGRRSYIRKETQRIENCDDKDKTNDNAD
jgi:predicted site-specific integrase-resolvase